MSVLGIVLLVLFIVVSLLLVFMVVIQDSDSDSLGGIFAGGSGSAFGSRSSNVVVRFTYVLGALFFVVSFALAIVNKSSTGNIEAAAKKKGAEATEWWNAPVQKPAAGDLQPAQPAPAPAPAGN